MDPMINAAIGLIVFTVILLGIAWLYKKLSLSSKLSVKNSKYIKSIDRLMISRDKWIEILQVGDETILIGITNDRIEKITNIKEESLKENHNNKGQVDFGNIFNKYYKKKTN